MERMLLRRSKERLMLSDLSVRERWIAEINGLDVLSVEAFMEQNHNRI
jgi:hypothetical protein